MIGEANKNILSKKEKLQLNTFGRFPTYYLT